MVKTGRDDHGEGKGAYPGAPEGGRSPTGGAGDSKAGNGVTALEPGQRWTVTRKREVVIRVMRGESFEALSRELGLESYRIQEWYERAVASLDAGLLERGGDPRDAQMKTLYERVGELTMMNELLQERVRRVERPFDPKRSRK